MNETYQEYLKLKMRIREREKALKEMSYAEYLASPEWQKRRKKHIKMVGFSCQLCNIKDTTLHVHHRTYRNRGNESYTDLTVLCHNCHDKFHAEMQLAEFAEK
jgi:5-methylcytosine-specific restriction endonuclease McrA